MNAEEQQRDAKIPEHFVDRTPSGDGRFEDVEFSESLADRDDLEAQLRGAAADQRVQGRADR